ncbi:MAG: hypothetical protein WB562_16500 [Candidatus Sulfotelmatobacter sp.]
MNRSPRPGNTSVDLPQSTHQRINMYALAAGAAGVSVLALVQPADAKIIYTPAHVPILGPHGFYQLDLNHDGVTDFTLANTTNYNTDQAFWNLFAKGPLGNAVVGTFVYRGIPANARAFTRGARIGPGEHFSQGGANLATFYYGGGGDSAHGNWVNVTDRYLGMRFQIDGQTHYGWARLTVKVTNNPINILAELTGYAYETLPDMPIIAGKTSSADAEETAQNHASGPVPATLGLLAMGTPALSAWRRQESVGVRDCSLK